MNERIRELHSQCKVCDNGTVLYFDYERFAELIVLECADIIESQDVDPSFRLRMSWAVKKHFGVK